MFCVLVFVFGTAPYAQSDNAFSSTASAAEASWTIRQAQGRLGTTMKYARIFDLYGNGAMAIVCKRSGDSLKYLISISIRGYRLHRPMKFSRSSTDKAFRADSGWVRQEFHYFSGISQRPFQDTFYLHRPGQTQNLQ